MRGSPHAMLHVLHRQRAHWQSLLQWRGPIGQLSDAQPVVLKIKDRRKVLQERTAQHPHIAHLVLRHARPLELQPPPPAARAVVLEVAVAPDKGRGAHLPVGPRLHDLLHLLRVSGQGGPGLRHQEWWQCQPWRQPFPRHGSAHGAVVRGGAQFVAQQSVEEVPRVHRGHRVLLEVQQAELPTVRRRHVLQELREGKLEVVAPQVDRQLAPGDLGREGVAVAHHEVVPRWVHTAVVVEDLPGDQRAEHLGVVPPRSKHEGGPRVDDEACGHRAIAVDRHTA
mmetsp:Transcript_92658/g.276336  ORF Transcript_92658/g.276336 Transcript_92658/m.276336 type:complete len:281 (+) Transcript_92658:412-1254(+)